MEEILERMSGNQLFTSAILIFAILAVRVVTNRWLETHSKLDTESKRRIKINIKNGLFLICLVALIFVWAPSLRTFALSLTAFTVAIILATKELILCISGYVLKSTSGIIGVGDWIEVNGIRGEVVDLNIMTTTVEELGKGPSRYEFTGKTVALPNSLFLSSAFKNERFNKRFTFHHFDVVTEPQVPSGQLCELLMGALKLEIAPFSEVGIRYKSLIEKRAEIALPEKPINYHLSFAEDGKIILTMICFVPTNEAIKIEKKVKKIAADFISDWYAKTEA